METQQFLPETIAACPVPESIRPAPNGLMDSHTEEDEQVEKLSSKVKLEIINEDTDQVKKEENVDKDVAEDQLFNQGIDDNQKNDVDCTEANADTCKDLCENHVDFAVICSFFQQFGTQLGINYPIEAIKVMLEDSKVPDDLIDLHVKLLRKIKKYVNKDRWENGLVKFVLEFSHVDAWEIERFGYKSLKLDIKVNILKRLLESQFDFNQKFKVEINNIESLLLRLVPIGRDVHGNQYWYHLDEEHTLRIYREQPDEEKSWTLICQDRDEFQKLIKDVEFEQTPPIKIESNETSENEDSNLVKPEVDEKALKEEHEEDEGEEQEEEEDHEHSEHEKEDEEVKKAHEIDNQDISKDDKDSLDNQTNTTPATLTDLKSNLCKVKQEENVHPKCSEHIKQEPNNECTKSVVDEEGKASSLLNIETRPKCVDINSDVQLSQTTQPIFSQRICEVDHQIFSDLLSQLVSQTASECDATDSKNCDLVQQSAQPTETTDDAGTATKPPGKKRGRKRKGLLPELNIQEPPPVDLTPLKRSSRIQKLQEKRDAELKVQMELEQKRLEQLVQSTDTKKRKKVQQETMALEEFLKQQEEEDEEEENDERETGKKRKRRKKKGMASSDSEFEVAQLKSTTKKKKRGRKPKKEPPVHWSSNEEHEEEEEQEEEEEEDFEDEEEEEVLKFEDNHDEFECEEFDPDEEPVILKRARTARKIKREEADEDEVLNDDTPCQNCHLYTNPEWILLCDNCDLGYHTDCLIPKLYLIPDGDWYCPKCENVQLLEKLKFEFDHYVANLAKREREQLRKQRLKYVAINIGNIIQEDASIRAKKSTRKVYYDDEDELDDEEEELEDDDDSAEDDESDDERRRERRSKMASRKAKQSSPRVRRPRKEYSDQSDEVEESETNASENISSDGEGNASRVRSARKRVSYQFKEYDDLIDQAIRVSDYEEAENPEEDEEQEAKEEEDDDDDDAEGGKSVYSRGKDISNLAAMDTGDLFSDLTVKPEETEELQKPNEEPKEEAPTEKSGDERQVVKKSRAGRKKSKRKLNDLDSPDDDPEEDSDFSVNVSSNTELEDEEETEAGTEADSNLSDEESDLSDWNRGKKRRSSARPISQSKSKKSRSSVGSRGRRRVRRGRYDSSDEDEDDSDFDYRGKRSRTTNKRVSYKEVSSTEEEEGDDDDYSDSSEKKKKKGKKGGRGRKNKDESDFTASESDQDNYPAPKPSNRHSVKDFVDDDTDDDERRVLPKKKSTLSSKKTSKPEKKSKRNVKKKVYDDYTDGEETAPEEDDGEVDKVLLTKSITDGSVSADAAGSVSDQDKKVPSLKVSLRPKRTTIPVESPPNGVNLRESDRRTKKTLIPFESADMTSETIANNDSQILPTIGSNPANTSALSALTAFAMTPSNQSVHGLPPMVPLLNNGSAHSQPILMQPPPLSNVVYHQMPPNALTNKNDSVNNSFQVLRPPFPPHSAGPPPLSEAYVLSSMDNGKTIKPVVTEFNSHVKNVIFLEGGVGGVPRLQRSPLPTTPGHAGHSPMSAHHHLPPTSTYASPPMSHATDPHTTQSHPSMLHTSPRHSMALLPFPSSVQQQQQQHQQQQQNPHLHQQAQQTLLPPHLAGLPPQIASQLASQHQQQLASQLASGFPTLTSYPPHFYPDPTTFAYFGHQPSHPAYHPQMAPSYHPHHPGFPHPPPPLQQQQQPHLPSVHVPVLSQSTQQHPPVSQAVTSVAAMSNKGSNRPSQP